MNQLAVAIAIVLLPGLIASIICDKITVHSARWDVFKYTIYSFIFGISSYALLEFLRATLEFLHSSSFSHEAKYQPLKVWLLIQDEKAQILVSEVAWAVVLSPIIAIIAAVIVNYKLIHKFAQKFKISQKYGDENLFSFFLNAQEVDWVYVRDKSNNLTYCGRIFSHSECESIQEIVLSDVTVFDYESSAELYKVASIYLCKPLGSFVIEVAHQTP